MFEVIVPDLVVASLLLILGLLCAGKRRSGGSARKRGEIATGAGLVGLAVLLSPLCVPGPVWVGMPVFFVAGLGWSIWFDLPGKGSGLGLATTAVFACAVVHGYGTFLNDWSRTVEPGAVVQLVPQQASSVDERTLTYFQGTRCLPELRGTYTYTRNDVENVTTVAPLVHQSWSPGQPVHAWINIGETPAHGVSVEEACAPDGGVGIIAGLRVLRAGPPNRAIEAAVKRPGLSEVENAPLFRFAPTKRKVIQRVWSGRISAAVLLGFWGLMLLESLYDSRKRK